MNIHEYNKMDVVITNELYKSLFRSLPWYTRLWYRIRFGSNWMMKR